MVVSAKDKHIVEARFSALRPMFDVMAFDEDAVVATWKPTAPIAPDECTLERVRNRPCLTADGQDGSLRVLGDRHESAVAGEPARRLRGNAGAISGHSECSARRGASSD